MYKYMVSGYWFEGHQISGEGIRCGYVDYACLAKAFDHVLANDIVNTTRGVGFWEIVNGSEFEKDEDGKEGRWREISQSFIISRRGAEILTDCTEEIVLYNEKLDLYVWRVTHFGTNWDYVLTEIPAGVGEKVWLDWYNRKKVSEE